MKSFTINLFVLFISIQFGFSQESKSLTTIQYLQSSDLNPLILREAEKYILFQEANNKLFKDGFGFIVINNIKILSQAPIIVTDSTKSRPFRATMSFSVSIASHFITPNVKYTTSFCESCYPPFYTKINNHVILIYDQIATLLTNNRYSTKSQNKLAKLLTPHFKHTLDKNFEFYSIFNSKSYKLSEEKRKKLTRREIYKEAAFVFREGRTITILQDGSAIYK